MKSLLIVSLVVVGMFANTYSLKPISITKDIHCVIGDFNPPMKSNKGFVSNMCYVDIGDTLVVLDAGPTYIFAKEFHDVMKKDYPEKKVSHVVITNFHDDRIFGSSYFKQIGAKIVGYKNIEQDIKANPDKFERLNMILDSKIMAKTKLVKIDLLVDNGFTIKGSKKTLQIIKPSTISEEKSDIAIYSKDDSFVYVGNIVFNGRMLNYTKNSRVDGWIEAIENLAKLNAKYFLGGHGKEFDKNSYKDSLEYLKILKHDVKKAFENDIDREDLKEHFSNNNYKNKNIPYYNQLNYNNMNNYYDQLEWAE